MKLSLGVLLSILALGFWLTSCQSLESQNFSARPGFGEYFQQNPPSEQTATPEQQALLRRYQPRLFAAKNQPQPIDFYTDYIAQGELYLGGELHSATVDQALLNQYKNVLDAEFRYLGSVPYQPEQARGYGRVTDEVWHYAGRDYPLTYLRYNYVFATSGLIKGINAWSDNLLNLFADNADWHQLDHYVGLTVVLWKRRPVAVMLQQHNYQNTYLLGLDITWPQDDRVAVDIALQSNELYLHQPQAAEHPAVSFINPDNLAFIRTGEDKPIMAGWDMTHGEQEVNYTLKFLPDADAFYRFQGWLGARRHLPGRDGPPGADYVTLPELMPQALRMVTGYRPGSISEEAAKLRALFDYETFRLRDEGLAAYAADFLRDQPLR